MIKKLNCLVVEDVAATNELFVGFLNEFDKYVNKVHSTYDVETAIQVCATTDIDFISLDHTLSGMKGNGDSFLRELDKLPLTQKPFYLLVSADNYHGPTYSDFYENNLGYLVKEESDVLKGKLMRKVMECYIKKNQNKELYSSEKYKISTTDSFLFLLPEQILYIWVEDRKLTLTFVGNSNTRSETIVLSGQSLSLFVKKDLQEDEAFQRINGNTVVNVNHINRIRRDFSELWIDYVINPHEISGNYRDDFKKKIKSLGLML